MTHAASCTRRYPASRSGGAITIRCGEDVTFIATGEAVATAAQGVEVLARQGITAGMNCCTT